MTTRGDSLVEQKIVIMREYKGHCDCNGKTECSEHNLVQQLGTDDRPNEEVIAQNESDGHVESHHQQANEQNPGGNTVECAVIKYDWILSSHEIVDELLGFVIDLRLA